MPLENERRDVRARRYAPQGREGVRTTLGVGSLQLSALVRGVAASLVSFARDAVQWEATGRADIARRDSPEGSGGTFRGSAARMKRTR